MHYRSAVLFGSCTVVADDAKADALDRITDHLIPGRVGELRRATAKELAATQVLSLPIDEWSLKVSAKWPEDFEEDIAGDAWAGVVSRVVTFADPRPAPDLRPGIEQPESVRRLLGS